MDSALRTWRSLEVEKCLIVSKAALLTYDYLITIDDEVTLVWPSGLCLVELLFYAGRYSAIPETILELLFFFADVPPETCRIIGGYLFFSMSAGIVLGQAIVVVRTWAIWNGSRAIKLVFGAFGAGCLVVCAYLDKEWIVHTEFIQMSRLNQDAERRGCDIVSPYRLIYICWILFCAMDTALICLTAVRCRQHFRRGSPRLTNLLYRDAFAYFSITLLLGLGTLCVTVVAAEYYQLLLEGIDRALYTTLASRIVLHLRAAGSRTDTTVDLAQTEDVIVFADGTQDTSLE